MTLEGAQSRIWCSKIGWQTVPCSDLRDKGIERSSLGVRRLKVKVTGGCSYIERRRIHYTRFSTLLGRVGFEGKKLSGLIYLRDLVPTVTQ